MSKGGGMTIRQTEPREELHNGEWFERQAERASARANRRALAWLVLIAVAIGLAALGV